MTYVPGGQIDPDRRPSPNNGPHTPVIHLDEVELMTEETWAKIHDSDKMEQVTSSDRGVVIEDDQSQH